LEEVEHLDVENARLCVVHDRSSLDLRALPAGTNVVIYGHSHKPRVEFIDGVLYLNPGSAGPRRFGLPVSMALLHVQPDGVQPELIELAL
jgi:predicted phosphodiesterase